MINISIDLTKIDKSKIKEGKNGQKYYNITVDKRKEPDQYGNTHTVYQSQSKDEKGQPKVYLGNAKEYVFGGQQSASTPQQSQNFTTPMQQSFNPSPETIDDLPF